MPESLCLTASLGIRLHALVGRLPGVAGYVTNYLTVPLFLRPHISTYKTFLLTDASTYHLFLAIVVYLIFDLALILLL